jgi:hypothetical protein
MEKVLNAPAAMHLPSGLNRRSRTLTFSNSCPAKSISVADPETLSHLSPKRWYPQADLATLAQTNNANFAIRVLHGDKRPVGALQHNAERF